MTSRSKAGAKPQAAKPRAMKGTPSRAKGSSDARRAGPEPPATYLYAVLQAPRAPSADGAPPGPPHLGPLRFIHLDHGLWLAAADAPLSRYATAPIERGLRDLEWVSACAVAHEKVVAHLARHGTVVPMKLFTLFTSDARAAGHVGRSRRRLDALFERLAGRQEWGVRVSVGEAEAKTAARERAASMTGGMSAGTRFLSMKREEQAEGRRITERGRQEAERVFAALQKHADESRRRPAAAVTPGSTLLLDAVFLVRGEAVARFQEALRRHAERLDAQGYRVVLTGPWPAYNFVAET